MVVWRSVLSFRHKEVRNGPSRVFQFQKATGPLSTIVVMVDFGGSPDVRDVVTFANTTIGSTTPLRVGTWSVHPLAPQLKVRKTEIVRCDRLHK